jgi:hypothetical protein
MSIHDAGWGIIAEDGHPGGPQVIIPSPVMPEGQAIGAALRLDAEATLSGIDRHHHAVALTRLQDIDATDHPGYWRAASARPDLTPPSAHLHPHLPARVDPDNPLGLPPRPAAAAPDLADDDVCQCPDPLLRGLEELRALAYEPSYTDYAMGVFASFLSADGTVHTPPYGGDAA